MSTPVATVSSRAARPGEIAAAFTPDTQRAYKPVLVREALMRPDAYPAFRSPITALGAAPKPDAMDADRIAKYVGWGAMTVWGGVALLGGFFVWRLLGSPMPKRASKEG